MSSTVDQVEEVEESDNEHITFKDSNESFNESINELDNEVDSDYESEDDGENVIQSTNGRRANIPPINAIDEGKKSQNINPSPHKFGVNIPTPHPYTSHSTFSDTSDHEHSEEQPASSSNTNTNNRDINLQRDTAPPVFSGYPQAPINQDALYVQAYNSGNILATEHRGGYSAPPPYSGAPQTPMPYSYYYSEGVSGYGGYQDSYSYLTQNTLPTFTGYPQNPCSVYGDAHHANDHENPCSIM